MFITNGGSGPGSVFATLDKTRATRALLPSWSEGRPKGLTVGKHQNKMGQRATNTVALTFEDVRVPVENRIGEEGEGFQIAMETLDNSRPLTAMFAIGIARAALEYSVEYAGSAQQFGKPITSSRPSSS